MKRNVLNKDKLYIAFKNKKIKIIECNTFKSKLLGLCFVKNKINYGIMLPNCNSIHTFFMKQVIDICVTDKSNKIIYLEENVVPNKILIFKGGYYIYELPLGTVKHFKINNQLNLL